MRSSRLMGLARESIRLFRAGSMQVVKPKLRQFSQNRVFNDNKTIPIHYLSGAGLIGAIAAITYFSGAVPVQQYVKGKPASAKAIDPNNPDRIVWRDDEITHGSIGDGAEGRSCPFEATVVHGDVAIRGYRKTPANGRSGTLNELVYHELAKKVLPGRHPQIKLIEYPIDDKQSNYELFIESIGDNMNLLQYCKLLAQDPDTLESANLEHLGCSLAFATLILSADNFMKNFVVINNTQRQSSVYPIDFEVLDRSKTRDHDVDYIHSNKEPHAEIESYLIRGGLLDYKDRFTLSERIREQSGAEDTADIGKGWTAFGKYSRTIHQIIVKNAAKDIANGHLKTMYNNIAALDEATIDSMLDQYTFLMTEKERDSYKHELLDIVRDTQEFVAKFNQSSNLKP